MRRILKSSTIRVSQVPALPVFTNAMGTAVLELPILSCDMCGTDLVDSNPVVHCPKCGYNAPRSLP